MPENLDVVLEQLKETAQQKIAAIGTIREIKEEPVAFGIKAIIVIFSINEEKGGIDELENELLALDEVSSVDVIGLTRAFG